MLLFIQFPRIKPHAPKNEKSEILESAKKAFQLVFIAQEMYK